MTRHSVDVVPRVNRFQLSRADRASLARKIKWRHLRGALMAAKKFGRARTKRSAHA